jgi:predicted phosphodiesterase
MRAHPSQSTLSKLFKEAPVFRLSGEDKIVVFSDLHLGDGGKDDDFLQNAQLFSHVLENYYFREGFTLVLNGDIEELKKFPLKKIAAHWGSIYRIFNEFRRKNRLYKIVGNHDYDLCIQKSRKRTGKPIRALKIEYDGNILFVYHGHQASKFFEKHNQLAGFLLRYIVFPLGIKNYSVSHDSTKKFKLEKRVYDFSIKNKIISIIGHTHRPLFESLSKIDSIKFKIEQLCRQYTDAGENDKKKIETEIAYYRAELEYVYQKNMKNGSKSSLYNANLVIPCLFNSGCVIGKRGMTSIEIAGNEIALAHWFDKRISIKHFSHNEHVPERLGTSEYYRLIIKKDYLDYIFTRIKLLT